MTEPGIFTILRGLPQRPPVAPKTVENLSCYTTDDGRLVLILPGHRPQVASRLGEMMGVQDPAITICDHYCTITTEPDRPSLGPDAGDGYQMWIALTTVAEQQLPLADYNVTETVSAIRHLPGFRSASFFRQHDQPVVHEHVVWQSEQHFVSARQRPEFTRHLNGVSEVATATWNLLKPLTRDDS